MSEARRGAERPKLLGSGGSQHATGRCTRGSSAPPWRAAGRGSRRATARPHTGASNAPRPPLRGSSTAPPHGARESARCGMSHSAPPKCSARSPQSARRQRTCARRRKRRTRRHTRSLWTATARRAGRPACRPPSSLRARRDGTSESGAVRVRRARAQRERTYRGGVGTHQSNARTLHGSSQKGPLASGMRSRRLANSCDHGSIDG